MFKIGELSEKCGLPATTISHYVKEGLIDKPHKTARNMAYYDKESIPKILLIKKFQEELRLSLKEIKMIFVEAEDMTIEDYETILEVKKRLAEESDLLPKVAHISHKEVMKHISLTEQEMADIEERGAISPVIKNGEKCYDEVNYRLIKALSDVRKLIFSADRTLTVMDLDIYLLLIRQLTKAEAMIFVDRIARGKSADEIFDLVRKGIPAFHEVVSALHNKFIMDELELLEKMVGRKVGKI